MEDFPMVKPWSPGKKKKNRAPGRTPIARIRRAGIRPQFHQAADQGNLTPCDFRVSLVFFGFFGDILVVFSGDFLWWLCETNIVLSRWLICDLWAF